MTTTLLATALPHSLADDAPFQLSVFFTHKLQGDGGTLADYPAALNWVETLNDCRLTMTIEVPGQSDLVTLPLRIVSEPDADAWRSLLPGMLPVNPFPPPEPLSNSVIHSNPASRMSEHAIDLHLAAMASSPIVRPRATGNPEARKILEAIECLDPDGPLAELFEREEEGSGSNLHIQRLREALDTIGPLDGAELNRGREREAPDPAEGREERKPTPEQILRERGSALDGILNQPDTDARVSWELDQRCEGLPISDDPCAEQPAQKLLVDAHATRRYYERPTTSAGQRPERPKWDFHQRVGAMGAVPALLRRLGLVVDVVVEGRTASEVRAALSTATSVAVEVESPSPDLEVTAPRRTSVRVSGETFQSTSTDWVDGMLPLGNSEWVVLDVDPDAAGLKIEQYVRSLVRNYAVELNGDQASAAPATIRSTGFALARRDRATHTAHRLQKAESLVVERNRTLELDDLVRGFRLEVWDDRTKQWHSLHRRRVDITGPDGAVILTDAEDIGFLQGSGLHRSEGSDDLYLHEVIAGWDGWSLSAPRPGLIVERVPEPGHDEPSEKMVKTPSDEPPDGPRITARVEPGTLPALRYDTSYSFRVLAVDLAGNSTPNLATDADFPLEPGPTLVRHLRVLEDHFAQLDLDGLAAQARTAEPESTNVPDRVAYLARLLHTGEPIIDGITRSLLDAAHVVQASTVEAGVGAAARALQDNRPPTRVRPQLDRARQELEKRHINSSPISMAEGEDSPWVTVTLPRPYLRWEPVAAPAVVARSELDPGEQLGVLVVRSGGSVDRDRSERHLVPPKATQLEAETAGLFDNAVGTGNAAEIRRLYAIALAERGTLLDEVVPSLTDPNVLDQQPNVRLASRPGAEPDQAPRDSSPGKRGESPNKRGEPLSEGHYIVHDVDRLRLPYLPEPFTNGVSLVFYEAGDQHRLDDPSMLQTVRVPYPGKWPEKVPLRLVVKRGERLGAHVEDHVVYVSVPPGEQVRVGLASTLDPESLDKFGLWRSHHASLSDPSDGYTPDELVAIEKVRRAAVSGWLWWLTPSTPLRLVHAVPAPVRVPSLRGLRVLARPKNRALVALAGLIDVHGRSTDTLTVRAEWSECVDDPGQPRPLRETKRDVVVHSPVAEDENTGLLHLYDYLPTPQDPRSFRQFGLHKTIQFFPDTHRRLVTYYPGGTTRYAEFFKPDELPASPLEGQPVALDIASSARPAAPVIDETLPLLRWSEGPEPDGPFAWQRTRSSGLRVWLERPWFSSGDGELLGVLIFDHSINSRLERLPLGAMSLWAADPILDTQIRIGDATALPLLGLDQLILEAVQTEAAKKFGIDATPIGSDDSALPLGPAQPVAMASNIPLVDEPAHPKMRVVGYRPEFDADSRRWFVDIALHDPDFFWKAAASPFIRLALARWQPHSLPGCELSSVTLTKWAQPVPERRLTVNRPDANHIQITVTGVADQLPSGEQFSELPGDLLSADAPVGAVAARAARLLQSRTMHARLEFLPDGGSDLEWTIVASTQLVPAAFGQEGSGEATWARLITVSQPHVIPLRRPGAASEWRIVVEEHELLEADSFEENSEPRTLPRLVYADLVHL